MKVSVQIPEGLHEITLGQYQHYMKIEGDETFKSRKALQIFCGVHDPLKVSMKDVRKANEILAEAFQKQYYLQPTITYQNKVYGFIPNLEQITFGEYIDLDTYFNWPEMHKAMSVLYRPITRSAGEVYKIEEYNGSHERFKGLTMDVVMGATVFFWNLGKDLSADILKKEADKQTTNTAQGHSSAESGDGSPRLMASLGAMLQSMKL